MVSLNMRIDQVLLGRMSSMAVVGNYTAAIRLSEIWYAIPMIVTTSVMPRLLKTRELNPERYYARLQVFYESMILVSVLVTAATLLLGPLMIRILYGTKYFRSGDSIYPYLDRHFCRGGLHWRPAVRSRKGHNQHGAKGWAGCTCQCCPEPALDSALGRDGVSDGHAGVVQRQFLFW